MVNYSYMLLCLLGFVQHNHVDIFHNGPKIFFDHFKIVRYGKVVKSESSGIWNVPYILLIIHFCFYLYQK